MRTVQQQILSLILTIGIGFLMGIIYDIYRVNRFLLRPKKLGTILGDLFFWIVITILVFSLLLIGNQGEVRVYVFLGLGFGFYFYNKFCSLRGRWIIDKLFSALYRGLALVWKGLSWTFRFYFKKGR